MTKIDYTLAPAEFDDVLLVLMNGAKKYERNGWEKGIKFEKETNIASIKRHLAAYRAGESKDDESGLHHLLHAACRALMQYTLDKRESVARVEAHNLLKSEDFKLPNPIKAEGNGCITIEQALARCNKKYYTIDENPDINYTGMGIVRLIPKENDDDNAEVQEVS
jgi:hypothetical protein